LIRPCRRNSPPRRPNDELLAQQVRFNFIAEGIDRQRHAGSQRLNTRRPAAVDADQQFKITAILFIQSIAINLGHVQGSASHV
jgi:hypothetical protein